MQVVPPHRAYRTLANRKKLTVHFLANTLLLVALLSWTYHYRLVDAISYIFSLAIINGLQHLGLTRVIPVHAGSIWHPGLFWQASANDKHLLALLAAILIIWLTARKILYHQYQPAYYFLLLNLLILLSSVFWLLCFSRFPYDLNHLSRLYMKIQLVVWLVFPASTLMLSSFLPINYWVKGFTIMFVTICEACFSFVRLQFFFFCTQGAGQAILPLFIFIYSPISDFFFFEAALSWLFTITSLQIGQQKEAWKWLS
ncbi:MAG: hypothetical protein ACUVTU_08365 [Desulfurispora sp.]|uniref:hypothetical protein n=1 Tax=Desulfurispora sp. TaxID=3014275 RepID=UPI00404A1FCA